jgi:YD repeat-containing protein
MMIVRCFRYLAATVFAFATIFALGSSTIVVPALAANGSVAYTYDALGRVTTASYDTGVCIIYTYDANNNRLSETIRVSAATATGVWGCFNWNASGGAVWGP